MLKKLFIFSTIALFTAIGVSAQTRNVSARQRVTVNLYEAGYKPDSFRLRRGVLAKITFIRRAEGCGDVLVIPAYGVRRDLPLNQPIVVTFRPRQTGTFKFACGMDMYRGKIIVI